MGLSSACTHAMTRAPNAGPVRTQYLSLPQIPEGLLEGSGTELTCSQGRTRLDSTATFFPKDNLLCTQQK